MRPSAATNAMNGRVFKTFREEVEEGRAKIWKAIPFSKRVNGDHGISGLWLRLKAAHGVEKECGASNGVPAIPPDAERVAKV